MKSFLSRLYSWVRRLFSSDSHVRKILSKTGSFILARKYLIAMLAGAIAIAAGSIWLHLKQAQWLGQAEESCETRFAQFELQSRIETQLLLDQMREEAIAERERLVIQRNRQAQETQALREMFDITVSELEKKLNEQANQQPEIVPWLDTPVPQSLLQD